MENPDGRYHDIDPNVIRDAGTDHPRARYGPWTYPLSVRLMYLILFLRSKRDAAHPVMNSQGGKDERA
jgi:hypothetical protein